MKWITKEEFGAWLDSMPDDFKPCDERQCPISVAMGGIVGSADVVMEYGWHRNYATVIDTLLSDDSFGWRDLTVADLRSVWREVP